MNRDWGRAGKSFVSKQPAVAGFDHHQSVLGDVSVGQVPPGQGWRQAHVLLDHDDYLPRYVLITEARRSDVKMADALPLNPGSIVVMDRGYNDYALLAARV
jgi:hypothetical protein